MLYLCYNCKQFCITVGTVQELDQNLQLAVEAMRQCDQPVAAISSGCELFMRFITFAKLDVKVNKFSIYISIINLSFLSFGYLKSVKIRSFHTLCYFEGLVFYLKYNVIKFYILFVLVI